MEEKVLEALLAHGVAQRGRLAGLGFAGRLLRQVAQDGGGLNAHILLSLLLVSERPAGGPAPARWEDYQSALPAASFTLARQASCTSLVTASGIGT